MEVRNNGRYLEVDNGSQSNSSSRSSSSKQPLSFWLFWIWKTVQLLELEISINILPGYIIVFLTLHIFGNFTYSLR